MTARNPIHVCWTIDCEATQKAIDDTALGIRSLRGFSDLLLENGCAGTLFVVPGDARAFPALLRELAGNGLQIGLHFHLQELGFTSCSHSMPGRNLPGLRSNWVNAPLSVHSTHRANRLLE